MRHPQLVPALAAALALAAAPQHASAQEPGATGWGLDVAVGAETAVGHTTYRIEGSEGVDSIASELEFPLHSLMLRLRGELAGPQVPGEGRAVFQASVLMSPRSYAGRGTMRDSDWLSDSLDEEEFGPGAAHPGKDIYSESDAELDALVIDARAAWEFRPPSRPALVLAPMIGLLYQRFEYDVTNVRQVGYGPYEADYTGSAPGSVLAYRVAYRVPYVGARAALSSGRVTMAADMWFSPFASADDRDDHILRAKLSETDADGYAWQASIGTRLAVGRSAFVQAEAATVRVHATGTQHQRFYAGSLAGVEFDIGSKITSARSSFLLSYVQSFAF